MVKLNGAQIHTEEFEEQMKNLEPSDIHRLLGYFKYEFQTKNKIIYNTHARPLTFCDFLQRSVPRISIKK